MLDVSVSVKPDEARTLWLDTRDRMLPPGHSLYFTLAGAGQDFNAKQLDGAKIRLRFKPRAQALPEHIADRFAQMRDNMAFLVEEHTNTKRLARYDRLDRDLTRSAAGRSRKYSCARVLGGDEPGAGVARREPAGRARRCAAVGVPPGRGSQTSAPLHQLVDRSSARCRTATSVAVSQTTTT